MRAQPGELLGYGRSNRKTGEKEVVFEAGLGVAPATLEWFRHVLSEPQYTILCMTGAEPWSAFTVELANRGYDLATFRFSIRLTSAPAAPTKQLRRIQTRPGLLNARWARDPVDGTPDLCSSWQRPCSRADLNLLFALMSTPFFSREDLALRRFNAPTVRQTLEREGFDIRTFRFSVRKPATASGEQPGE